MAINLRRPPVDVLHLPTIHDGLSYIGQHPDWIIRPVEAAKIRMFAESENPAMRAKQKRKINLESRGLPDGAMEIRTSTVMLEDARFANGLAQISDRFWLNGASGRRVRTKFEAKNPEPWRLKRYHRALERCHANGPARISACDDRIARKLDIAVELKNGFNYYHFSTETLGSLAHYVSDGTTAPITLHLPQKSEIKDFVKRFIDSVFPGLADRVRFEHRPKHYDRVRSVYSHRHLLYCADDMSVEKVLSDPDLDPRWSDIIRNPGRYKKMEMLSYDMSLRLLREAGLAQIQTAKTAPMPKLIWMGRDEGGEARARGIEGHEPLLEELGALGFEQIAFELLSPLEQISAMNGADVVIAPHGAGLTNMIYAKPGATVVEIGTRQTQLHRWGDFLKCAHVSRCRYDTVFADIPGVDDLAKVPKMSAGHRGVKFGRNAIDRVIAIAKEAVTRADHAPSRGRQRQVEAI